jgi:hypothetical protein
MPMWDRLIRSCGVSRMRIALAIPTLNGGGAEHVMSTHGELLGPKHGHDIHLITHDRPEKRFLSHGRQGVRHGFDISKPPRHVLDTVSHKHPAGHPPRACMKDIRPDAVISFTVRMNTQNLIALLGTKIPVIVIERNNPLAQRRLWPFDLPQGGISTPGHRPWWCRPRLGTCLGAGIHARMEWSTSPIPGIWCGRAP